MKQGIDKWLEGKPKYVVWLNPGLEPSLSLVGSKVLGVLKLMRLRHIGFDVPAGFVITTEAYDEIFRLEAANITKDLKQKSRRGVGKTALMIQGRILTERLKPYSFVSNEVTPAYNRLCEVAGIPNVGVAVRSSGTHEDLRTKSYAGSYESYLNIRGLESLITYTVSCFAHMWKKHLLMDMAKKRITKKVKIAALVQKMICSDVAGVVFTADPLTGDSSKIYINCNWGLGDIVVSGRVSADIFIIDKRSGQLKHTRVGEKSVASRCRSDGGTFLEHLSPEMIHTPSLTPDNALRLAQVCLKVETELRAPVDIEWAFQGGRIYLLQVRPITTL